MSDTTRTGAQLQSVAFFMTVYKTNETSVIHQREQFAAGAPPRVKQSSSSRFTVQRSLGSSHLT